jgi:hypothetical protein
MKHHITLEISAANATAALHAMGVHARAGRIGEFVVKVKPIPGSPSKRPNPLLKRTRR